MTLSRMREVVLRSCQPVTGLREKLPAVCLTSRSMRSPSRSTPNCDVRVFLIPGVEERESQLSLPGARALWLADDVELARPEVLQSGREFGHIHPDGSLHLWLPVERAKGSRRNEVG